MHFKYIPVMNANVSFSLHSRCMCIDICTSMNAPRVDFRCVHALLLEDTDADDTSTPVLVDVEQALFNRLTLSACFWPSGVFPQAYCITNNEINIKK